MKKFFILFLFLSSMGAQAKETTDVSTWSLRYLARASNFLLVASDRLLENKKALCGLEKGQPEQTSQNLKSLIDEKIKSLNSNQKSKIKEQAQSCETECTCDIYLLAIEDLPAAVSIKAQKVLPEQRSQCASKFKEFCQSRLFKSIR